ncbi:2-hydroxy-3-oxopropionate reductase [bacterium BMS3Abin04]|nr:2-hydroxy-3-oxopropionate reductase [bacterium BMS3Abin04]
MKLGLVGTGLMGKPMAISLLAKGFKLTVFNRTKSKLEGLEKKGAVIANSSRELIKLTDVVVIMLSNYTIIKEVLLDNGNNYSGKTIIQMSTIAPDESLELKKKIENMDGKYFEAPVLGSIPQIKEGELIILVGSTTNQFKQFHKLLEVWASKIIYVGEVGKAAALKLALNQLIISETTAFAMSLGYVRKTGVDVNIFMDILRSSALYAPTFDKKLERYLKRDFSNPNFPVKHLLKDLNIISKNFGKEEINNQILEATKPILQKAIEEGLSDEDYSALYNIIHPKE